MIAYLRGLVTELTPTTAVVECAGVGYLTHISLTTYTALQGQKEFKLFVSQIIREDAHLLYGFATEEERQIFSQLITVSGVGPNTARVILSTYNAREVSSIIAQGLVDPLKAVKGIGLKTAQRIVVDLKGKIADLSEGSELSPAVSVNNSVANSQVIEESVGALRMLGYPEVAATKVVRQLLKDQPTLRVEEVIKQSLKLL